MTPIAAFSVIAAMSGLMLIVLAALVVRERIRQRISLAHGDPDGPLHRTSRAHANFTENAPIFLLVLLALALQEASSLWVLGLGVLFLLARASHAYGVATGLSAIRFRQIGMLLTWTSLLLGAGIAVGLAFGAAF